MLPLASRQLWFPENTLRSFAFTKSSLLNIIMKLFLNLLFIVGQINYRRCLYVLTSLKITILLSLFFFIFYIWIFQHSWYIRISVIEYIYRYKFFSHEIHEIAIQVQYLASSNVIIIIRTYSFIWMETRQWKCPGILCERELNSPCDNWLIPHCTCTAFVDYILYDSILLRSLLHRFSQRVSSTLTCHFYH